MQVLDYRYHGARIYPVHEGADARFYDGFGLCDCGLAVLNTCLHKAAEVIHRVQEDVVEATDLGFDIAWHGEVDHEHWFVTTGLDRPFHHAEADDRQG
ncbi:hypothetical protein D3C81_1964340 [compost metagenome]